MARDGVKKTALDSDPKMSAPHITVSYNGGEKRVPLSVQPSLELTDSQVDRAEGELHRVLRKLFNVDPEVAFYLHEVETKRVMSKESFREPSYCQSFPTHWYLVMDSYSATSANGSTAGSYQVSLWQLDLQCRELSHLCVRSLFPPHLQSFCSIDSSLHFYLLTSHPTPIPKCLACPPCPMVA